MLLPVLKFVHNVSLYALLGAPVFFRLLWRPSVGGRMGPDDPVPAALEATVKKTLSVSGAAFVASGLIKSFVSGGFGPVLLFQWGLAWAIWATWDRARPGAWAGALAAAALAASIAFTKGAAGAVVTLSTVNHFVHLSASALWAGALLHLAFVPWGTISRSGAAPFNRVAEGAGLPPSNRQGYSRALASMVDRFSCVAFAAVAVVALTGAVASYINVYTPAALARTTYGLTLTVKIGLFLALLLAGTVNFLFIAPGLRRASSLGQPGGAAVNRVGTVLRIEAFIVVALLAVTGVLSSLSPRDALSQLAEGRRELALGSGSVVAETAAGDVPGALVLDLHVIDDRGRPAVDVEEIVVEMEMPAHSMGLQPMRAQPVAPGHYRANALLSMEGEWETYITATFADGEQAVAAFAFEAFEAARSLGMTRRLEPRAIFFEFAAERADAASDEDYVFSIRDFLRDLVFSLDPRPMYFISGAFWFVAALFVVAAALRGAFPRWVAPLGMVALAVGGAFLLSSMFVNAYPTTYVQNPVPFTAASVDEGYELYLSHCSVCHGMQGYGDGPMAPFLDPPPEDLRVRHIDAHPDGELFWWFSHGIPGSDMPGNEATMTERERWHVVNFVRSLHRPVPGAESNDPFIQQ